MPNPHGTFIWYELLTTDTEASGAFYTDLIGWTRAGFDSSVEGYQIFSAGEAGVGGMMKLPDGAQEKGMRPGWFGYIGVDDVDASVAAITAAGGAVHMPAMDMEGVGRMAMVADPQGVVFYVMRGTSEQSSNAFDPTKDGHCSWNELSTSDPAGAIDFYTRLFNWTKGGSMAMGEMGDYQFLDLGGKTFGAVMKSMQSGPPPAWTFYFRVPDIDAATDRAKAKGANIMHGPAEVPGGDFIIVGADPQGATFALVGPKK